MQKWLWEGKLAFSRSGPDETGQEGRGLTLHVLYISSFKLDDRLECKMYNYKPFIKRMQEKSSGSKVKRRVLKTWHHKYCHTRKIQYIGPHQNLKPFALWKFTWREWKDELQMEKRCWWIQHATKDQYLEYGKNLQNLTVKKKKKKKLSAIGKWAQSIVIFHWRTYIHGKRAGGGNSQHH